MGEPARRHQQATAPGSTPAHRLVPDKDEITHLVCCRDVSWRTAFCGSQDTDTINPAAETICTMCIEAVEALAPGFLLAEERYCPVDGNHCPDEYEVDLRIARETDPTAG